MTLSKADEAESRVAGSDAGREDRLQISTKDQAQNRTKGCPGEELPKLGFLMCPESPLFIQFLSPCRQLLYDIKKQGAGRGALESGDLPSPHRIDHALSIDSVDTKRTCPEIQNGSLKLLYK